MSKPFYVDRSDDDDDKAKTSPAKAKFFEFDCPVCSANNPVADGFMHKEEVMCQYCGCAFEARVSDELKITFKER